MDYAIELDGVTKQYANFSLKDVSFKVPKGSIMGFVGENGAGKTTTLKAILNLIRMDKGNVTILGTNRIQEDCNIKEQIGVVFDESYFHENLNVNQISKIMKHVYKNWQPAEFDMYVKKFRLPTDKVVKEYSSGMKMKLSIAVALSHKARLLILDEATSGLDPVIRDEILDIFLEFIQDENNTILLSSHITSDLEKVADYITFIHQGQIVFSESKDELIYQYGVVHCKKEELSSLNKKHIVGVRTNQFGCDVMVNNKKELLRERKDLTVDNTTIEEIILFKVRGE
ncbi:ABC transporter [Anaerocolumna cellulosilytica]|uniref:ABC transporter n=2 Tax=Anaerocolumna cellulosilytica TaxID=433286 RepID=A0A6S6QZU6_9FIRM|nr:ABC transporter ATP-binding protein [Anaerocolumna cellulosilytica]BCJ96683.1 ABC transporter [Anaerocolumna cellulosilytica]